jgi:hypothetical protein
MRDSPLVPRFSAHSWIGARELRFICVPLHELFVPRVNSFSSVGGNEQSPGG